VRKAPPGKKAPALRQLLDSLGFFLCAYDTLSPKNIRIDVGGRGRVDSIRVRGGIPLSLDSIAKIKLPCPYDAGFIQFLAKKTISFLGARGYPFAAMTVTVRAAIDSSGRGGGKRRQALVVVFTVHENGRYAFARPLLIGTFKTGRKLLLHDVTIREGDLFDLRKVEESREKLLSRPYVASVDVSSPAVTLDAALAPDTGAARGAVLPLDKVMVPFSCADKSGFGLEGALTFQAGGASVKNSLYGIVNISLLNILHAGETGELSYNGQQGLQRLELSVSKPYLLDFPVFASGDFGLEIQQDSYGYLHGGLEGLMELRAYWQLGLAVTAHEVQTSGDSGTSSSNYVGADIILTRAAKPYRAGELCRGFTLRTGSGIAHNDGRQFNREHVEATGDLQVPLTKRWAVAGRLVGETIVSDPADTLRTAELYRTGGYNSVRGYSDQEFAFKTVAYAQTECLFYFSPDGALYVFADEGFGFGPQDPMTVPSATRLFGYGLGIRIPSKIGEAAIEWGRNYQDTKSLGRVHISIMNPISAGMGK
jgi:hypothetical protein